MHKSDPKAGQNFDKTFDYDNNRIEEAGWTYDEDGRNVQNLSGAEALYRTFNAAGRLVRTRSDSADFRTYYDGDGDEIKRRTDTLNDETGLWDAQPTKYYIRSRVLGGRVVSEVWANGKKHRSFVKGIGNQTAVQSAYASETAQLNEVVLFEYSDASGMSYRTTNKLGEHAATGDGGEGSPIETDPLGGNIGTYTPFITLIEPFDPEYPELQTYNNNGYSPGPNFASLYANLGSRIADLPGFGTNWGSFAELGMAQYEERLENSRLGFGFITNEQYTTRAMAQAAAQTAAAGHETLHGGGDDGTRSGGDETGGNGVWVDQSTADVDLATNTVTIHGNGYFDFSGQGNTGNSVTIVYMPGEEAKVKRISDAAVFASGSQACADAFRAARATPVGEQGNTMIVTENVFSVPAFDDHWAPDDGGGYADAVRAILAKGRAPSGILRISKSTVGDITNIGPYVDRGYIALTNSGLRGDLTTLEEVVIHSFLHSGGVPGKSDQSTFEVLMSVTPQDLRYLGEKYENVKKHCLKK